MSTLLRAIEKMDSLLEKEEIKCHLEKYSNSYVVELLRQSTDGVRKAILEGDITCEEAIYPAILEHFNYFLTKDDHRLKEVINGTGIVLHTNLGRALLSDKIMEKVTSIATNYSNLEMDLESGKRGERYTEIVKILKSLTGCEDALIVNNNAAAVLLILNSLCKGKEAIVSRGELVEIGGSFRIPEVMASGGTSLKEVGTTNKTHLKDYATAISEETGMIVKVHTSNFVISGFEDSVTSKELVELGETCGIPVYFDLGSGSLYDLSKINDTIKEPTVKSLVAEGLDLLSFSGDKLLGGPQCGIILGKKKYIDQLKENQLLRAIRVDKLTLSALFATLLEYKDEEKVLLKNPTLYQLSLKEDVLEKKAKKFLSLLKKQVPSLTCKLLKTTSLAGGGALPGIVFPSLCVAIEGINAQKIYDDLRQGNHSIVGRICKEMYLLDVRTLKDKEFPVIAEAIKNWVESQ